MVNRNPLTALVTNIDPKILKELQPDSAGCYVFLELSGCLSTEPRIDALFKVKTGEKYHPTGRLTLFDHIDPSLESTPGSTTEIHKNFEIERVHF